MTYVTNHISYSTNHTNHIVPIKINKIKIIMFIKLQIQVFYKRKI